MDYEKKYKDAIPYIMDLIEHNVISKESAGKYFPELKESEDEKIRQFLIHEVTETSDKVMSYRNMNKKDVLAWLEKQGEQKPVDKVEPKFKVGDWIISKYMHLVMQIINNDNGSYKTVETDGIERNDSYDFIERNFKLWTIQDAKDGDVLANDHHILILKELGYTWASNGKPECLYAYCGIKPNGNFELEKEHYCFCGILHIHPATKEQRDQLEKAMADAGYTFDFEKKELKKIDNEIEIPFGAKDSELQEANYYIPKGFHAEIDDDKVVIKKGEQEPYELPKDEEIDEKHKVGKWFTGLIPCWINAPSTLQPEHSNHGKNVVAIHLKGGGYRCCCVDDKKPRVFDVAENTSFEEGWHNREASAWSEEDEQTIEEIKFAVLQMPSEREDTRLKCLKWLDWLKSLKQRIGG